ncbi:chorismate-binding protein [Cellulomonas sp.]|uniref:chorismate-binding protein n=1 Tax=Cellulomonas sp. TaxID=40001 RepID=UPI00258761F9|nr:chorismate-binding protein [Cellulomonas sp.]MCR6690153.1 chorismate-binding protein [Cellulomonas sp.]
MPAPTGHARFAGVLLQDAVECVDVRATPEALRTPGWWALVGEFEGDVRAWRFASAAELGDAEPDDAADGGAWCGPRADEWTSSLDRTAYTAAVQRVREHVREGDVYQANLCRVLSAPLAGPAGREPDAAALARRLTHGNPAPYAGYVHVPVGASGIAAGEPDPSVWVVSASPELFLDVADGVVTSAPIKGTARTPAGLTPKDTAENVMITDLVRNDLQRVCDPGSVEVTHLLGLEHHPGLVHLVSTVTGALAPAVRAAPDMWGRLLAATYPPGSVSGAPKSAALHVVAELEPVPRGPYCGLVGWLRTGEDGAVRARLAVGIRTFWWTPQEGGVLRFGTGAGITWGSDPEAEWAETELKAARLIGLASR